MRKTKLLSLGLVLCAFCVNAEAKLYKWVDDGGITHYGETIPPEYANKDATQLSNKGRVEKRIEKLTPEERRAKEDEDAKTQAEQQAAVEAKRKDTALLSTFSNEEEIDLARNRSAQQIEARVSSSKTLLASAQETLAGHHKEQDDLLKQNKKIPASLTEDIAEGEARVTKLKKDLAQNEQELTNVKARFEAEKLRYRELKGLSTPAPAQK
jgi:chromosome segregation ATPase